MGNWERKPTPCKVKNKNLLAIAPRAKTAPYPDKMQAIWERWELYSRSSCLVVLKDFVDLVCSRNKGSEFHRLDVYPERGNSLWNLNAHWIKSGQPHAPHGSQLFLFVRLIINIKLRLIFLLACTVLNWLVIHLFDSLGRSNKLRKLKHLAWSS